MKTFVPMLATFIGCYAGYCAGHDPLSHNYPTDRTGLHSIVIEYPDGWVELRGPGRHRALDEMNLGSEILHTPLSDEELGIQSTPDGKAIIANPYTH